MTSKNPPDEVLSARARREYEQLARQLEHLPLLAQGSVFEIKPPPDAPRASTRYMWTRKVNAKTVTKALSREEYDQLKAAIEVNRQVEATLKRMRKISHEAIVADRKNPSKTRGENRPKPALS